MSLENRPPDQDRASKLAEEMEKERRARMGSPAQEEVPPAADLVKELKQSRTDLKNMHWGTQKKGMLDARSASEVEEMLKAAIALRQNHPEEFKQLMEENRRNTPMVQMHYNRQGKPEY